MKRSLFLFFCLFILAIGINDVAAQSLIKVTRDYGGVVGTIQENTVLIIGTDGKPRSGESVRFYTGQASTQVSTTRDSGYTTTITVNTGADGKATAYMKVISVPAFGENVMIADWNDLERRFRIYTNGGVPSNQRPVFSEGDSTTRSIAENSPADTNIGSAVSATDAQTLRYALTGTDAASFSLDPTNGQLKTEDALDYETKNSYSVTVSAYDSAIKAGDRSITVTITVNDVNEAPTFASGASISNISATAGTAITSVILPEASDVDANTTLTYTVTPTLPAGLEFTASTRVLSGTPTTETASATYTYTASDSALEATLTFTIQVDAVPNTAPTFTEGGSTTRSVEENTAAGTDIGTAVGATDAENDTLTYTLDGTDKDSFDIVSTSGQIQTKDALDFESKNSYSVTVKVSDNSLEDSIDVTINVTDVNEDPPASNRPPVFTEGASATRSIAENTAAGTNIGDPVAATDPDGDTITCSISGADAAAFRVDRRSGQLWTADSLDYETKNSYSVTMTASDGKGGSDSIAVTINVTDVNEDPPGDDPPASNRPPTFTEGASATRSVAENTVSRTNIGDPITATDADNDTLTYSLGGTDAVSFGIISNSGQLRTEAALDYETKNRYSVTVTASDGKGGSDSIDVTINVTDVNENPPGDDPPANHPPTCTEGDSTTRSVAENTASGTNIGDPIAATDADNDTLTYRLGGTDAASFDIVSTSGQLQTKAALDYETKNLYSVTVMISDGKGGSDSIAVMINVTDVNENPPGDDPPASNVYIYWADSSTDTIQGAAADGSNVQDIVTSGLRTPASLAVDLTAEKLYWIDSGTDTIQRADLDGSNTEDIITTGIRTPTGIAVDSIGGKVYWIDSGMDTIQRANLDGSHIEDIITTGLKTPKGLAIDAYDPNLGKVYWIDSGTDKIQRANLDGSNIQELVTEGLRTPTSIAVDLVNGKMYWADSGTDKVQRANLDGSNIEDIVTTGLRMPIGIAVDAAAGKVYWIDSGTDKIQRANLDGSNIEDIVTTGLRTPTAIALSIPQIVSANPPPDPPGPGADPGSADVNGDGQVTVIDLAIVALFYGTQVPDGFDLPADVNDDGVVDITDLVAVAEAIDAAGDLSIDDVEAVLEAMADIERIAEAPAHFGTSQHARFSGIGYQNVAAAFAAAKHFATDDVHLEKWIPLLKELLHLLAEMREIPNTTALLPNYPNPFNPETWIPYHLATPAEVTLSIYSVDGRLVRTLDVGHQPAGVYASRGRAAYWDGKNQHGESVASGVYFYTLTAGEFTGTRKLLIAK